MKVSIIIPCYNYGIWLKEAIDSVLKSNYQDLEIIVVDDGSNDSTTMQIIKELEHSKVEAIKVLRQENQGVSVARNNGIKASMGEYILMLDADDYIHPDYIQKAVDILDNNSNIGIVYSDFKQIGEKDKIIRCEDWDSIKILYYGILLNTSFFRKKDWEKVGGYKAVMKDVFEDWEFWISLAEIGVRGYRIPEVLAYYRIHGPSRHSIGIKNQLTCIKQIIRLHKDYYIDNLEYVIYPLLIRLMKCIPLDIKYKYTKQILKNIFFSKRTFIHLKDAFIFLVEHNKKCKI